MEQQQQPQHQQQQHDEPDALDAVLMAAAAAPHAAASTAASAGLPASSAAAPLAFASPSLFAVPSAFFSDSRPAQPSASAAAAGTGAGTTTGAAPAPSSLAAALPSLFGSGGKGAAASGAGGVPVAGAARAGGGGAGSVGGLGGLLSPCPLVSAAAGGMLGAAALLAPGSASGVPHSAGPGDSAGGSGRAVDALGGVLGPLGHRLSLPPMGAGADDEEAAAVAAAAAGFWDEDDDEDEEGLEEDEEEEEEEGAGAAAATGAKRLPAVVGAKRGRAVTPLNGPAGAGASDGEMEEDGAGGDENEDADHHNRAFQMMLPLAATAAGTDKENAGDGGNHHALQRGRGGVVSAAGGRRHSTGSAGPGRGGHKLACGRRSMPAAFPGAPVDGDFSSGPPVPAVGKKRVDWSKGEPAARMRAAIAECREITQHGASAAGAKSWRGVARKYGISWAVLYPRLSGKISVDAGGPVGGRPPEEAAGGGGKGGKRGGEEEDDDAEGGAAGGAGLSRDVEVKLFNACCSAARRGRGIDWDGLQSLAAKQAGGSKSFKPTAAWARGFHARFPDLKRWRLQEEDGSCTFFLGREADAQGKHKGRRLAEAAVLTEDGAFPADSAPAPKEEGKKATGGTGCRPRAAALAALRVLEAAERDAGEDDDNDPDGGSSSTTQPNPRSPPPAAAAAAAAAAGALGRGARVGRPSRKALLLSGLDGEGRGGRRSSAGSAASDTAGRKRRSSGALDGEAATMATAGEAAVGAGGVADDGGAGSAEKRPRASASAAEAAATSTPTKQHRPGGSGLVPSLAVSTGAALASPSPVRASPSSVPLSERSRRLRWAAEGPVWELLRSQGFVADSSADRRISLAVMKAFVGRFHLRPPKRSSSSAPADDRTSSPATQQRARREDYMDFLRRLATLEAPLEGWTEAALEAYGRRQQQEHQLQQHQHQQQQPHLPSQDVATALLFSSPAPTAAPAATHPPAALTVQPPPMPLAFLLDAGALTTGPATASTVSLSPEASLTAASVAAAAAAAARARGHGGARSRVGLTVELPRDGDDIVDGAETGMASYLSSLASPGFHAGPSPTALAAAAAMAAAAVSGPYGGDGGSHHDGADDFFASPSPR